MSKRPALDTCFKDVGAAEAGAGTSLEDGSGTGGTTCGPWVIGLAESFALLTAVAVVGSGVPCFNCDSCTNAQRESKSTSIAAVSRHLH